MQKAIIIYNEGAGFGNNSLGEVEEALKREQFSVVTSASKKSEDLQEVLQHASDLVVVAGGDGTVKTVALQLMGKDLPMYIWPAGTSNNIGSTFGAGKGIPKFHVEKRRKMNVGSFQDQGENVPFLESAGVGLIGSMMEEMKKRVSYHSKEEKINKSLEILLKDLKNPKEFELHLFLDGELYHDKYLAVEVMNTRYTGPRLLLAPDADPGDGFFDVVLISQKQGPELEKYLEDRLAGLERPLQLPVYRARNVKMAGKGLYFHADDDVFFSEKEKEIQLTFNESSTIVLAQNS